MKNVKFFFFLFISLAVFSGCGKNDSDKLIELTVESIELGDMDGTDPETASSRSSVCLVTVVVSSTEGGCINVCGIVDGSPGSYYQCSGLASCDGLPVNKIGVDLGHCTRLNTFYASSDEPFSITNSYPGTVTIDLYSGGSPVSLSYTANETKTFTIDDNCVISVCP